MPSLFRGHFSWALPALVGAGLSVSTIELSCAAASDTPRPAVEVVRDCPDCLDLVIVPAGEFDMGSTAKPLEQPVHPVRIQRSFAIGRREVTFAEWDKCVAGGGCKYTPPDQGWGRGDRPVTNVSWDDAKEFTAWLSKTTGKPYRLPTEAEWEYAARGGSTTPYWWGNDVGTGNAQCMECGGRDVGKTAPVGSFRPNGFELYDMGGNAAEWVEDCWNLSYRGAPTDWSAWTSGDCSHRVLRGGSFADNASAVRPSARFRYDEDVRYYANGFRIARDAPDYKPPQAPAPASPAGSASTAGAPPPTPIAFEDAILKAANDLFTKADLEGEPAKVTLVIDPLIDGLTGARSNATLFEQKRIIGTFTSVNNAGAAIGPRDAYQICLALADLNAKKIISKGVARALPDGVDPTPTPFFADRPVFLRDPSTIAYIKSCQATKPGDAISQVYADRIFVASLIDQATEAYNAKRYRDALDLYRSALQTPGGEQSRVLNGIYLANEALHRHDDAVEAFGKIIDFGLKNDKLAINFLFQPGSTIFVSDPRIRAQYDSWLATIAKRTVSFNSCLEIVGHTSATGIPALNDQLSVLRAQYVKDRLEAEDSTLRDRLIATGKGSRELIVGTGRDDASDALDRRVEFDVIKCEG